MVSSLPLRRIPSFQIPPFTCDFAHTPPSPITSRPRQSTTHPNTSNPKDPLKFRLALNLTRTVQAHRTLCSDAVQSLSALALHSCTPPRRQLDRSGGTQTTARQHSSRHLNPSCYLQRARNCRGQIPFDYCRTPDRIPGRRVSQGTGGEGARRGEEAPRFKNRASNSLSSEGA